MWYNTDYMWAREPRKVSPAYEKKKFNILSLYTFCKPIIDVNWFLCKTYDDK